MPYLTGPDRTEPHQNSRQHAGPSPNPTHLAIPRLNQSSRTNSLARHFPPDRSPTGHVTNEAPEIR